ncbi:hypothetical protein AB7M17_001302 [Bradyrhizobium sp. USDA 377]
MASRLRDGALRAPVPVGTAVCSLPRLRGRAIAYEESVAGSSPAAILRDARLRRALRMRTEYVAAIRQPKLPVSLILRRPRSGRLEGRGACSGPTSSYAMALRLRGRAGERVSPHWDNPPEEKTLTRRTLRVRRPLPQAGEAGAGGYTASPKYKTTRTGASSGSLEVLGGLTKPHANFIEGKFFRLMLSFVSIVSSVVTLPCPGIGPKIQSYPLEIIVLTRRNGRRRRP